MALEEIARGLGEGAGGAFKMLPALWTRTHDPLLAAFGEVKDASGLDFDAAKMQELVDSFQLARSIAAALAPEDLKVCVSVFPCICLCLCLHLCLRLRLCCCGCGHGCWSLQMF